MAEKGRINNPLVAQEEAGTILESVRKKSPSIGYQIDQIAINALNSRTHDYVLTAQADKTVRREKEARRDELTGLLNRRAMREEIQDAMEGVKRDGGVIHVVFMDLRGFKKYNDTYGHEIGDVALRSLAEGLMTHTRPYDKVGRWGGEEFIILLLENSEADIAQTISDRLHNSLRELPVPYKEIFADMGMASYGGSYGTPNMDTLINRADKAMYFAKQHKLNQVKHWDSSL